MKRFSGCVAMAVLGAMSLSVQAEINKGTHLHTSGQMKVNKAMAKGYLQAGAGGMQQNQTQVNFGSRRQGTCNMNVGTQNPGDKNAKEVIVTSKEIINICK